MKVRTLLLIAAMLLGVCGVRAQKEVMLSLPKVFGNNMVLQRGIPIPVWGEASPGAGVIGKLGNTVVAVKASREGKWVLHFPKQAAGGPYALVITEQGKPGIRV